MDRSAIDTIRGYCYQFDKSIFEILSLEKDADFVEIEGIEDVDVESEGELRAVQCKYYEKTSYSHSVIAKPIRLMLQHFSANKDLVGKYHLFGHYKDGQEKLILPVTVDVLKERFLTYKKGGVLNEEHMKLGLSDSNLQCFLQKLILDINARSFEEQQKAVIDSLERTFSCSAEEARHYFYNSAFNLVVNLACSHTNRKISKSAFLQGINNAKSLFNLWLYKYRGRNQYLKKIRADLFTRNLNTAPFNRFFIIDISGTNSISEIKECIYIIQKNWSNLSKRSPSPYSPFIYIHGQENWLCNSIKNDLYAEGLKFSDGYNFKGSEFCVDTMLDAKESKDVKFQFVETQSDLESIIKYSKSRTEVYQFFLGENDIDLSGSYLGKNIKIQIHSFGDIKDIV